MVFFLLLVSYAVLLATDLLGAIWFENTMGRLVKSKPHSPMVSQSIDNPSNKHGILLVARVVCRYATGVVCWVASLCREMITCLKKTSFERLRFCT